jgi:hypothetical protein
MVFIKISWPRCNSPGVIDACGRVRKFLEQEHTKGIWKLNNVLPLKISIDNRKEKEYAGFITHFYLLLHMVTLDIEARVP